MKDKFKSWDVKKLNLCLGGVYEDDWIKVEIFNDDSFNMYCNQTHDGNCEWAFEDASIEAAKKLRDFLIYALEGK
jgi:hypothetical protein